MFQSSSNWKQQVDKTWELYLFIYNSFNVCRNPIIRLFEFSNSEVEDFVKP